MNALQNNDKMLNDTLAAPINRILVAGAFVVVALLFVLGLAANINAWILTCIILATASGFAVMLWPPSKDEREAVAWWNNLAKSEREYWLMQGGTNTHRNAWEAYKRRNPKPFEQRGKD